MRLTSNAEVLWDSEHFWSQEGLQDWFADQLQELLYDYVDPRTKGKARIELRKLKRSGELSKLREIFEQEFGGGALAALREKEVALKEGIPGADGVAFSERVNMRDKLHQR